MMPSSIVAFSPQSRKPGQLGGSISRGDFRQIHIARKGSGVRVPHLHEERRKRFYLTVAGGTCYSAQHSAVLIHVHVDRCVNGQPKANLGSGVSARVGSHGICIIWMCIFIIVYRSLGGNRIVREQGAHEVLVLRDYALSLRPDRRAPKGRARTTTRSYGLSAHYCSSKTTSGSCRRYMQLEGLKNISDNQLHRISAVVNS
jgi:hypothetical protein